MSSKIYSHSNGNLLSEHLFFTAKVMQERAMFDKEFVFILGICHDFGKLTSFFQEEKILQNGKKYRKKSNHTLISIHFTLSFLKHYGIQDEQLFLLAIFVINHHSDLRDINDLISSFAEREKEELLPQIKDLSSKISIIENVYKEELITLMRQYGDVPALKQALLNFNFEAFLSFQVIKNNRKYLRKLQRNYEQLSDSIKYGLFFKTSYFYSLLIFSDRNMAAKLPYAYEEYKQKPTVPAIPINLFERRVKSFKSKKEDIRQQLFDTLNKKIESEKTESQHIFTVTAPTGAGKTLATLNFALKLKEKHKKEKLIYALPLTNIIEQNYNEIKNIFTEHLGDDFINNEYSYLIKHHYLADYQLNEQTDIKEVLKTVETWDSQIVVTTFIQLFYAFSSNRASYLYRFSALQDSVLVFDEPQVLNAEHWLLIRKMLFWLIKNLGVKIILMTATKPLIFNEGEYVELTTSIDFKNYIEKRGNRHKLIPAFEKAQTIEKLTNFVKTHIKGKKSALIVLNTKKSSIDFFNLIQEQEKEQYVYYLSTTLTPYHRREVISQIQRKMRNPDKKIIVVSTQVIEAGVDLDFEIGFRDLAPLDSIIQTAGRINRHFLRKEDAEPLYIVRIEKENGKLFGDFVYDKEYLERTKSLLNKEINESEFESLIENYFNIVQHYVALSAQNIEKSINSLDFQELSKKFQIISKNDYTIPLFLEINQEAKSAFKNYNNKKEALDHIDNYEEKYQFRKELQYLQRKLYRFMVNVNANNKATDDWLTVINKYDLDNCYQFNEKTKVGIGIDETSMGRFS